MGPLRIDLGAEDLWPLFISPDSQRLFARSWPHGTLKVCSLQAADVPEVIEDRDRAIRDAALLGANRLAVLLEGGRVKFSDLTTYETVDSLEFEVGADRLACSSDGNRMAIGPGSNAQIAVFNLCTREKIQELNGLEHGCNFTRISFSPDGRYIIAIGDYRLGVWDQQGTLVAQFYSGGQRLKMDMAVTPDGTKLIWIDYMGSDDESGSSCCVWVLDLESNEKVKLWELASQNNALRALDISHDGRRVIAGGKFAPYWEARKQGRAPEAVCEWPLDAPDGFIRDDRSFHTHTIGEVQGDILFARLAPDGSKIVAFALELIASGSDFVYTGNRFITVWDYPRHHLL